MLCRLLFEFRFYPPLLLTKLKVKALLFLGCSRLLRIEDPCRPDRARPVLLPGADRAVFLARAPQAPGEASCVPDMGLGFANEVFDLGKGKGRKMSFIKTVCSSSSRQSRQGRQASRHRRPSALLCCCL